MVVSLMCLNMTTWSPVSGVVWRGHGSLGGGASLGTLSCFLFSLCFLCGCSGCLWTMISLTLWALSGTMSENKPFPYETPWKLLITPFCHSKRQSTILRSRDAYCTISYVNGSKRCVISSTVNLRMGLIGPFKD